MYWIALCDDEEAELDKVEGLLVEYERKKANQKYRIDRFKSAEALLAAIGESQEKPDILLLDIFMSGQTGLKAAEELRRRGVKSPFVFMTTSSEYALEAYEVDALQYIVKPVEKEKFFHAMDIAFQSLQKMREDFMIVRVAGGSRQINPNSIVYCETQKNYQVLHLKNGDLKVRMTGGELYGILEKFPQFCRCGSSFILNLQHIVAVDGEEISMDNGSRIYMPRNRAAEFRKIYFSYYFETE
ncbi:MAG: LytTR family DNA-binding domain-containing protein [Lachnospiraceae bacterium]|nr:LytTR family DNA-binding domain-containing protein [Lachnospiraceae bacterium]